jgi:hypothetical protein
MRRRAAPIRDARNLTPGSPPPMPSEARLERAAVELAEARRASSDGEYSSIARLAAARSWGVPKTRALFEGTYFAGLRKAGMPDK